MVASTCVLTLVPPHRTLWADDARHDGADLLWRLAPGGEHLHLLPRPRIRHHELLHWRRGISTNVDKITALLERVEAMDIAPTGKVVAEDEGV